MDFFLDGFREGFVLLFGGDVETWHAIGLSLWTSLLALTLGAALGVPVGTYVGLFRPRGARLYAALFRAGTAFPTVVIGLLLYGLLCYRGPLAGLHILFTPWAVVIGQSLLALPILASLSHAAAAGLDPRAVETVRTHGGSRFLALKLAVSETRSTLVAAMLLAFGRCVTELGIVLAVGGTISGYTRTLPAQISLETSRGEFGRGLGSGFILVLLACGAALLAPVLARETKR